MVNETAKREQSLCRNECSVLLRVCFAEMLRCSPKSQPRQRFGSIGKRPSPTALAVPDASQKSR